MAIARKKVTNMKCKDCKYHQVKGFKDKYTQKLVTDSEMCYYEPAPVLRKATDQACHHITIKQEN